MEQLLKARAQNSPVEFVAALQAALLERRGDFKSVALELSRTREFNQVSTACRSRLHASPLPHSTKGDSW